MLPPSPLCAPLPAAAQAELTKELLRAAYHGSTAELQSLLHDGALVDAHDGSGWTALHWAATHDRVEAAMLLLEAGASLAVMDKRDKTPLDVAKRGVAEAFENNLWRLPRGAPFDVAQYTAAVKCKFPSRRRVVVNFTLKGVKCDVVALHAAELEAGGIDEVWVCVHRRR
jgi:hypothetical protein